MDNVLIKKIVAILLVTLTTASCRAPETAGFYQPITMSLAVPEGPAEYQAGWHAGCNSALAQKAFSNSWVYKKKNGPDLGNGVYQHDSLFQTGWGQGWFSCILHVGGFVDEAFRANKYGPLE